MSNESKFLKTEMAFDVCYLIFAYTPLKYLYQVAKEWISKISFGTFLPSILKFPLSVQEKPNFYILDI